MVLSIFESATANAGNDIEICGSAHYALADAVAENYTEIIWTTAGDGTFDDATLLNPVYTPGVVDNEQGLATLTLTAKGAGECDGVSTIELSLKPFPTATFDLEEATLCLGEGTEVAITLTGVAPWTIEFNNEQLYEGSDTDVNVSLKPVESGANYVIVSDASGCTGETEIMFTVLEAASFDLGEDIAVCGSNTIELDATSDGDYSYSWLPGNEISAIISADSTGVGFGEKQFTAIVTNNESNCVVEKTVTITFMDCTGLDENAGNIQISMYPNPASSTVYLEMSSDQTEISTLEITDVSGRIVYKEDITTGSTLIKKKLDVNFLAEGTYFVNIKNNHQSISKKLILKK
ncbi:MAG: T9SS type A sorting domain-containing protein [Bacteroidales bacterium]|nr:T9SS type A sorting domain-containing protein [Bacteroidales bacterium]